MARRMIPSMLVLAVLTMAAGLTADTGNWEPVDPNAPLAKAPATPAPAAAPVLDAKDVAKTIAAADAAPTATAAPDPAPKPAPAKPTPAAAPKGAVVAIVVSVKGVVERRQTSDPKGTWQPAKPKDPLTAMTLIRTGFGSQAVIQIRDRVRLTIRSGAKVGIGQVVGPKGGLIKTRLGLKYGAIRTQIDRTRGANDVRISTPDAALAVTGSDGNTNHGNRTDFQALESTWRFTVADQLALIQPGQRSSTSNTPQSRTEFFDRAVMPVIEQAGRGDEFGYGGADGGEGNALQYAGNPGGRWIIWDGPGFAIGKWWMLNCYGTGHSHSMSMMGEEYSPGYDGDYGSEIIGKLTNGMMSSSNMVVTGVSFGGSGFTCVRQYVPQSMGQ